MDVRVKYIEVNIDLKPVRKVKHMTFENKNHLNKPITDIRPSLKEEREQPPRHIKELKNSNPILLGDFYHYQTRSNISGKMQFIRDVFLLLLKNRIKIHGADWYQDMPQQPNERNDPYRSPEDRVADLVKEANWYIDCFETGLRNEADDQNRVSPFEEGDDDIEPLPQ